MPDAVPPLKDLIQTALDRPAEAWALQFHRRWYDWGWMKRTAERLNALLDEAGIGPGDAVAIAPANRPACAAALLGLIAAERDIVMIYAYQTPEALALKVRDLNCAAVLLQAEAWAEPTLRAVADAGAVAISLSEDSLEIVPGTKIDRAAEHRRAAEEAGVHLLTSGTTGPPKLRHLKYDFISRCMVVESAVHVYGTPAPTTPTMHGSAFGNISGLYAWLPHVVSGRPVVMSEKFNLAEWLDYVREWNPVSAGMPPAGFRQLMDADVPAEALAGIKYMSGGASAFDADLQAAVQEKYGVIVLQAYGATEFGGVVASMSPEHIEQFGIEKSFSVGRPWAGSEFRIVDPDTGQILPANQPGELYLRVPRVGPDWIRTSDLAKVDDDGFLYYLGRSDGAIVRGGFKIDPEAVRAALMAHPAIFDAIVAGAPDRRLGEVPVAAYVVRRGMAAPSVEDLKAHMRDRLPATFIPTGFRELKELPYTPTNKQDLGAIRAMFSESSAPITRT
jgi:acyl-CoA synthetase (AMP-forming)/AMP-acid ligase II